MADCEKHGDQEGVVRIYNNIFGTFYSEDKYEKGITYLQKALHLSDSLGLTFFKAANLTNLGETYKAMKQYDLSYRYSQESLALYRQLGDKSRIGMVLKNLGQFAQDIGDHQKAIDFLEESLEVAQEMNYRTNQKEAYENLAISYAEVGQLEKAFAAQQSYILIKDSLVNEASNKELNELKTRFETEQKEQAIAQLEERHADDLRKRRWLLAGLGLLSLLTLITLWAIWQKRRAYSDLLVQQQKTQTLLEEKEEMLEQLIQSEKLASIGELTAGIAHEINNPINFVASNTQALQQDFEEIDELLQMITQLKDLPIQEAQIQKIIAQSEHIDMPYLRAEIQQLIDSIKHGADRTIHIVDSIRHFSRHNKDAFQKANIHQAIDSALTILNNQISKDIQLHRDYGELPLVACQINKISQVFLNIINNAIQAIGNKGELRISTQEQGNWVLISIADNGPGMDEVTRSKIFQPFFTTKDKDKGTGLGLSISHRIIQAHGGRIEVQSQLGEGSVFLIYLPIQQQHKKAS
ncbi:MAG: ATP-binding protein [Bacteroidota bacterium]